MRENAVLTARFIESLNRLQHLKVKPPAIREISSMDVGLMLFIYNHSIKMPEGVTVSFISDSIGVTRSSVTQQTNRLFKLGYITKLSDATDRRSVRIKMTDDGLNFIRKMDEKREIFTSELISYLGIEDSNECIRLLDKISEFIISRKKCGGSK